MLSPYMLWSQASSCLFAVYRYQRFRARGKGEQRDPRAMCLQKKILPPAVDHKLAGSDAGSRSPDPLTATTPPALYVSWRRTS